MAVLVWSENGEPHVWHAAFLAAATGYMGHGYAIRLKRELIELARIAGVNSIRSVIDFRNRDIRRLNESLGATFHADPTDPSRELLICEISVPI